jgi:hypothetical protein
VIRQRFQNFRLYQTAHHDGRRAAAHAHWLRRW